ncbi:hypothetical protein OC844_006025 [Tilletia horrida]|nr:hypothetical protein OC844_006025 [Tilletia horrida]
MAQTPSPGRFTKWPTHLAIFADVDLAHIRSEGYLHFMDGVLFDNSDNAVSIELSTWGRVPPNDAAYLISNVTLATHPMRLAVADAPSMRPIPSEIDGSSHHGPSLPPTIVWVIGIGVMDSTDNSRKEGLLVGYSFMGKSMGHQVFKVKCVLEDTARYQTWTLASPRTLVAFEGILHNIESDGTPVVYIRRMNQICEAPRPLLQELGVGQTPATDRAAKRADLRQASKAKRARSNLDANNSGVDATSRHDQNDEAGPSTPTKSPVKSAVKKSPTRFGAPSSPTLGLLTRKRSRTEHA